MRCLVLLVGLGLLFGACSGTETGNPIDGPANAGGGDGNSPGKLLDFKSSACKKGSSTPSPEQQPLVLASDTAGLMCFEWERQNDGALTIQLHNFDAGCVQSWNGAATLESNGSLELVLTNASCMVARCGSCVFDFRFDIAGLAEVTELPVRVGFSGCATEAPTFEHETKLAVGSAPHGIVCRYMEQGILNWTSLGQCGERNQLCGSVCGSDSTCGPGLECTPLSSPDDSRCLQTCASDADCPAEVMSCQAGLCRPATTW